MFVWPIVRGWNVHRRYLLEGHTPLRGGLRSDVVSFGWRSFLCKFSARRWRSLVGRGRGGNDKKTRRGGCLFWFMRKECSFHRVLCVLYLFRALSNIVVY